jgi:hypothetical protein
MAKPEVKMVRSTATQANREPVWEVIVDYGGGVDQITAPSSRRFVLCPTPLVRRWSHDMVESALRSDGAIFAAMSFNACQR